MPRKPSPIHPEELKLWKHYAKHKDDATRNVLTVRYAHLVTHAALKLKRRVPDTVGLDELVSAGTIGLMQAIASFDIGRGNKFATYAPRRIAGSIMDWLREMDWVPRLVRSRGIKLAQATETLDRKLRRPPTDNELAQHLHIPISRLEAWQTEARPLRVGSLDKKAGESIEGAPVRPRDLISDPRGEDPTRPSQRIALLQMLTKGCQKDERLILLLYYFENLTMREIGDTLGLSESRVSQMHSALVQRLRTRLAGRAEEFA